jgi:hypothetical protein
MARGYFEKVFERAFGLERYYYEDKIGHGSFLAASDEEAKARISKDCLILYVEVDLGEMRTVYEKGKRTKGAV